MPVVEITVECPVFDSFRVEQVAGMFDVPLAAKATQRVSGGGAGGLCYRHISQGQTMDMGCLSE